MTEPSWFSQPFSPAGGITAEGLRNQLGRPELSVLTVLVREAAQNSWDAKESRRVRFSLDLRAVGPSHMPAWRELLRGAPREAGALLSLNEVLRRPTIRYLAVVDRGTSGLGGPTRSDRFAEPGHRGWLSFVLNSGEKQDTDGGGGTYGYGKGAFFLASRVGTVLIHTRFKDESGILRTRLIGSSLLASYNDDQRPFTGRHWWGDAQVDHCEPLTDEDAIRMADRLGLPAFDDGATGTTVVVLEPDLRDPSHDEDKAPELSMHEAGEFLADAAAWNLWPLTLEDRSPRMDVSVAVNGERVPVPDESTNATLAHFATAYRRAAGHGADTEILCKNPRRLLGHFAAETTLGARVRSRAAEELGLERDTAPHHIALMRRPDLVVGYYQGQAKPHPELGYAGVFKVDDALDTVFSRSEPPTHDAWVDAQLAGYEATFVRVARRRVGERCAELAGPKHAPRVVESTPVGAVSQRLGFLLAGVGSGAPLEGEDGSATPPTAPPAPGPGGRSGSGGGGAATGGPSEPPARRGRARRPQLLESPRFENLDGTWLLVQRVRTASAGRVRGLIGVVTGEGVETSAPASSGQPEVVGWRREDGSVISGSEIDVVAEEIELLARPVEDTAVEIDVEWAESVS
ncbi:hypothetical protein [Cellulosimicrobium cellulans]|uniref:hypothetical protein n=1 Tax=Cellulosimicrobium cellulans TaxID=1710 RepID=UPI00130D504D|nr:hypothetical protein [Cellulosimicrobium cellulans]